MSNHGAGSLVCNHCEMPVRAADDYCRDCGSLFQEGVFCRLHPDQPAEGICVICGGACCAACGAFVTRRFLCVAHSGYEIYEGMARVFGSSDVTLAQYAHACLEQAGLHPFLYSLGATPYAVGAPEYTLFRTAGDYDGHIVNEFKVMVPCGEVVEAERVLSELNLRA